MKPLCIIRLLLGSVLGLTAAENASAGLTPVQADTFVHDFYAVYNAQGVSRLMEFYTADATLTDPTFDLDLHNREEISKLLTMVLGKYESLELQPTHTLIAGDDLVVEGTMIGKLMGKTVHVRFASVFHFTNGKISAQRDMFDVLHFYAQLGVVPPQFRPKPAPAPKAQS
jgi:ketosteroid isomerase-like protein